MSIVRVVFYFLFIVVFNACNISSTKQEIVKVDNQIQNVLAKKGMFIQRKEVVLRQLRNEYEKHRSHISHEKQYDLMKRLYDEYHLYKFKNAYDCALELSKIAHEMNDSLKIIESKVAIGYVLARGGFFKESIDSLSSLKLNEKVLPDSVVANYYISFGRAYHDLADYTNDSIFSPLYNRVGNELLGKALLHISDSLRKHYLLGKIDLKFNRFINAKEHYLRALRFCKLQDKEWLSILYSTVAFIDHKLELDDEATLYYVKAVKNDIEGCIMESVSLRGLANLIFYNHQDFNRASDYISIALSDAMFYGTRHRMNVIGTLLPVFVGKKLDTVEMRLHTFFNSFMFSIILIILLIAFIFCISWQMKKIRKSKFMLRDANLQLQNINTTLHEVSRIKDCYIGHYLEMNFLLVNKLVSFSLVAQQKLEQKNYVAVSSLIKKLVTEHSRKWMYADFDNTFLSVFPSFIVEFNALLLPDEQIIVENDCVLNSTLRIYALVRLGIVDTEQIARILNYSFNTVYNYRIRIRNKAKDPKTFEEQVAKIAL